ncbi:AAA family ATPase [Thalassotalea fusca]
MKICFIWVKEFRSFKNFGLNLSSDYIYGFNESTNSLSRKEQKSLPSNFYGDGVEDITGLFGKNGSGKSNCLELICMLLKGGKSKVKSDFLIVYEKDGHFFCSISMKDIRYIGPKSNFDVSYQKYEKEISGIKVIYFSNVYDRRPNYFSPQVSDLSMNNLAKKSKQKSNSFFDQIDFIESSKFKLLEIPIPSQFCIEIDIIPKFKNISIKTKFDREIANLNKVIKNRLRDLTTKTRFTLSLNYSVFLSLLNSVENRSAESTKLLEFNLNGYLNDLIESNLKSKELSKNLLEMTSKIAKDLLPIEEFREFEDYLDRIDALENLVPLIEIESIKNNSIKESFVVNMTNSKSDDFALLLKCLRDNDKTLCSWLGISSGHVAYLNLFSSIFKELYRSRNDVILCIDEGDLYLHPQWQIEFFDKLLNVLPNLSTGKVQIVLTSHSPFLLSDLPNQSITVLSSDETSEATTGSVIEQKTFGANLYELYSNLFFLNKNRTGVFANNKIKKLLSQVEATNTDIKPMDVQSFSEIIGDKVIKHLLDKRVNEQ